MRKRPGLHPAVIPIAACVLHVAVCYPGTMLSDAIWQLHEARRKVYTDWHPPIMAFVWHYLDLVVRGSFPMLLLQLIFWWAGLTLCVNTFVKRPYNHFVLLLIGFWPALSSTMGAVLKDQQMTAALVFAVGLNLRYDRTRSAATLLAADLLLFYAVGLRYNALVAAVPVFVWSYPRHREILDRFNAPRWAGHSVAAVLTLAIFAGPTLLNKSITNRPPQRISQSLYFYDLIGISQAANTNLIPKWPCRRPLLLPEIKKRYTPRSSDYFLHGPNAPLKRIFPGQVATVRNWWWRNVTKYPLHYINHRWNVSCNLLGLAALPPIVLPLGVIQQNPNGQKWDPSALSQWYWSSIMSLERHSDYVFRPILYVGLLICSVLWVWVRKTLFTYAGLLLLTLSISGIGYLGTFILLTTSSDYRYSLWTMTCSFLCAMLALRTQPIKVPPENASQSEETPQTADLRLLRVR